VLALVEADADLTLLILVQSTTSDAHHYSVTHSLLVAALCDLAARQLPAFTATWRSSLRLAALTMNMAMTALQDQLALQDEPPSPQQRAVIDRHAPRAVACLREAGVTDESWLQAVEHHHASLAGPLAGHPAGLQLARLLQRADIFSARLSMRRARPAQAATAAIKAAYLDEHLQADEAGKALIQVTGIYPPGSYVRLSSGELAVVLRRGSHAKTPKVASIISRSGTPLGEPAVRDTRLRLHEVVGGVAPHEVKVRLNMENLLRLA
jgi:HD-GYP domain-containing protein (c-di-GMP phosphodiesterase class II)